MAEVIDTYARALAMAQDATLRHLFDVLVDKGLLTDAEVVHILSEALTDFAAPQPTDHQLAAAAVLRVEIERRTGGGT